MGNLLSNFIEKQTGSPAAWNDRSADRDEMVLLSNDTEKIQKVLVQRIGQLSGLVEYLGQLDVKGFRKGGEEDAAKPRRFLKFFSLGINGPAGTTRPESSNVFTDIRRIFQAKYLSDKWNRRSARPLTRFPEFVVAYYFKDDSKIASALHSCESLWKDVKALDTAEGRLFKRFLKEKFTLDELTFFLELRNGLLGLPVVRPQEPPVVKVAFATCRDLLSQVMGAFSPVAGIVGEEAARFIDKNKMIDYAQFLELALKFYSGERGKRRSAVKLMVRSQKGPTDAPIVLESFVAMIQSLGFTGSIEEILEFHRHAFEVSGGDITIGSVWSTMDDLNVHFASIDIPMETDTSFERSEGSRQMVLAHWAKFGQWFEGLRRPSSTLDSWVRSRLVLQVRKVEQAFQLNLPAATLFAEYRSLLDLFQFFLGIIARGSPTAMKADQSHQTLDLLERLNDHLLTFILQASPPAKR
jgi:hypothetical protein